MTQREFERRVKGSGKQPRRWSRRERSEPGRFRPLLKGTFAALSVVVLVGLTATATRDFSFKRAPSAPTAQLTGHAAVAPAAPAPAALAAVAHQVLPQAHLQRVAADTHRTPHHSHAAGARFNSSAALAGVHKPRARAGADVASVAVQTDPDRSAAILGGAVIWIQSWIRSAFAPVFGSDMAETIAQTFAVDFPVVVAAGAFILVMLLCLGAGVMLLGRVNRSPRVEAEA